MREPCCDDWLPGMDNLNGLTVFGYTHGVFWTAPPFQFCPWCGTPTEENRRPEPAAAEAGAGVTALDLAELGEHIGKVEVLCIMNTERLDALEDEPDISAMQLIDHERRLDALATRLALLEQVAGYGKPAERNTLMGFPVVETDDLPRGEIVLGDLSAYMQAEEDDTLAPRAGDGYREIAAGERGEDG